MGVGLSLLSWNFNLGIVCTSNVPVYPPFLAAANIQSLYEYILMAIGGCRLFE